MKKRATNQPNRCKDTAETRLTCQSCGKTYAKDTFPAPDQQAMTTNCRCGAIISFDSGEVV